MREFRVMILLPYIEKYVLLCIVVMLYFYLGFESSVGTWNITVGLAFLIPLPLPVAYIYLLFISPTSDNW